MCQDAILDERKIVLKATNKSQREKTTILNGDAPKGTSPQNIN